MFQFHPLYSFLLLESKQYYCLIANETFHFFSQFSSSCLNVHCKSESCESLLDTCMSTSRASNKEIFRDWCQQNSKRDGCQRVEFIYLFLHLSLSFCLSWLETVRSLFDCIQFVGYSQISI